MELPIKFRGVTREGNYIYGGYYEYYGISYIVEYTDDHSCPKFVSANDIAQLIGYDKNGREIYKGDAVVDEYGEGWAYVHGLVGHTAKTIGSTWDTYELKESETNEKMQNDNGVAALH